MDFCCHHAHSFKSFGDSILPTEVLVKQTKQFGFSSVTLTDHGSLVEMPTFVECAEHHGVKWNIGMEAYFVSDSEKAETKSSRHLITLVKNEQGWRNLLHLTWFANIPVKDGGGFFYRPRFTDKEIFAHSDGLIFSSACLNGVITDYLMKGDVLNARIEAEKWRDNVEHFYIEIMPHRFEDQIKANLQLVEIARDLNIPILATLDLHYEKPEQHESWLINGAIRRRKNVDEFTVDISPDMYIKSVDQIREDFRYGGLSDSVIDEAISNTLIVDNLCQFKWQNRMNTQPVFNEDIHAEDHLKRIAWKGLCARFGGSRLVPDQYIQRLKYEWEVISKMGFANYFLILHDMVQYAKNSGVIVGPGRGSAAGSMMLWALGVTEVDSLKYRLPFERFLNVERTGTVPDVDVDYDPKGREVVINYLKTKYGIDHVFQVSNHAELKAKSAIKDVARFFNYSFSDSQKITDLIPTKAENEDGEKITPTIKEIVNMPEVKPIVQSNPKLFEVASNIEGSFRQAGRHAAALIITSKPVTEIIPVMRAPGDDDNFALQTQWDKKQLERVGIHKYDILGISTLTMLNQLEKITGLKCVDIPHDDKKAWEFLRRAKNMYGIFQLSSDSMRGWCRKVIPEYKEGDVGLIDILSDVNAINRPAVLDAGFGDDYVRNKDRQTFKLPADLKVLEPILAETHGVILYQEQVQFIAKEVAGFSLGRGDLLRRNLEKMGTAGERTEKVIKENNKFKEEFYKGAKSLHNLTDKKFEELWNWLVGSSGYSFCKSHSWSYSLIGYWTAYYKSNYMKQFYTVAINESQNKNTNRDKDDPVEQIIREAQQSGIEVILPTNEMKSQECALIDNKIVLGLTMIKGISEKVAQKFSDVTFSSFDEFCAFTLSDKSLNRKHVEILIKLGYFSNFGKHSELWSRYQHMAWKNENDKKYSDWNERKSQGRKVKDFKDLKYTEEPLDGNEETWMIDIIGFNIKNNLHEKLKTIDERFIDNPDYCVGEVIDSKSGTSKFGRDWKMLIIRTTQGEIKGFIDNPSMMFRKGELIVAKKTVKNGKNGESVNLSIKLRTL